MPEILVGGVVVVALVVYALTGGADFGGGTWDLLATGRRKEQQRRAIERAIAPIWEANHVWLILVIVLLFVCFPRSFSAITTALHVPLVLLLIGIVLRGSAFVFRSYDPDPSKAAHWGRVFAVSSAITPAFLGITVGAVSRGIPMGPDGVITDFVSEWLAPFPLAVGGLVIAQFALLAAVYLYAEVRDQVDLADDFRLRGLVAGAVVFVAAMGALGAAWVDAPRVWTGLTSGLGVGVQVAVGLGAVGTLALLWARRPLAARVAVVLQVGGMVVGWGVSQFPYVLPPDLSVHDAAPANVLWSVLGTLAVGSVLLVPAFVWLYRVFKTPQVDAG